jgi:hypothetical protein
MQLTKLTALQACIAMALAAPHVLEKRGTVSVFLCTGTGFTGTCRHETGNAGQCGKNLVVSS